MTNGEAVKQLGLEGKTFDYAIPQSFFNDMTALFPSIRWHGVWMYDEGNMMGYPRPLNRNSLTMLVGYNTHYKTFYPTEMEVVE